MSLFVSTTGTTVEVPELGISIPHPTTNFEISAQFSIDEISRADSLTQAIESGILTWRKTLVGSIESASDYDKDWVYVATLSDGPSLENVLAVGAGGGGSPVTTDYDFGFKGYLSVSSDSSFEIGSMRAKIETREDIVLEVKSGALRVRSDGSLLISPTGSFALRSI